MNRRSFVTALSSAAATIGLKGASSTPLPTSLIARGTGLSEQSTPPSFGFSGLDNPRPHEGPPLNLQELGKLRLEYTRRQRAQPHRLDMQRRQWHFSGFDPDLHALRSFSTSARIVIQRERELASENQREIRYWENRLLDYVFDQKHADLLRGFM